MKQVEVIAHSQAYVTRSQTSTEPYTITFCGLSLQIYPQVFPTATDTRLLAEHISLTSDEVFLDLTTGSGAIAVVAGLQGARGIAIDINPAAVANAVANCAAHAVSVEVRLSNFFEQVPEKFVKQHLNFRLF